MSKECFPIKNCIPVGGNSLLVRIDHNNSSAHGIFNCDTDMITVCTGSITTSNEMYKDFKESSAAKIIYVNLISDGSLIKNNDNRDIFTRPVIMKSGLTGIGRRAVRQKIWSCKYLAMKRQKN